MEPLITHKLTKVQRAAAETKLRHYFSLPARISSLQLQSETSITAGYQASEVQRNSRPSSNVEKAVMVLDQIRLAEAEYRLLVGIRTELEEIAPELIDIWDLRYRSRLRHTDLVVMSSLCYGNRNAYYKAKDKLLGIIADRFNLWNDAHDH